MCSSILIAFPSNSNSSAIGPISVFNFLPIDTNTLSAYMRFIFSPLFIVTILPPPSSSSILSTVEEVYILIPLFCAANFIDELIFLSSVGSILGIISTTDTFTPN